MSVLERALEAQAQFLYAVGKDLFPRGWVRDAVAWLDTAPDTRGRLHRGDPPAEPRFAWVMPPDKLARTLRSEDGFEMPVTGRQVAQAVRRHGGSPGIFEYEYGMVAGDFLDRVPSAFPKWPADTLDEHGYPPSARMTFVAEPGYPWPTEQYYSARSGRWLRPTRPEWLLPDRIVNTSVDSYGVDLCRLFKPEHGHELDAVLGRYGRKPSDVFMVTHAMGANVSPQAWAERTRGVERCGGLLFPSLAVGPIPATNFGPCVLIADVGVVVNSLKPFRSRGVSSLVHVFDTDAWSGRTADFLSDAAVSAFEQLHGHADYVYIFDTNVWSLGPPREAFVGPEVADRLDRAAQLKRELATRFRLWRRDLEPEEIERMQDTIALTKARYGYLEAKVAGVLPIRAFPVAVAPRGRSGEFERFLDATGFEGDFLEVELPDELWQLMQMEGSTRTWADLQYGWHILDVVRERYPRAVEL